MSPSLLYKLTYNHSFAAAGCSYILHFKNYNIMSEPHQLLDFCSPVMYITSSTCICTSNNIMQLYEDTTHKHCWYAIQKNSEFKNSKAKLEARVNVCCFCTCILRCDIRWRSRLLRVNNLFNHFFMQLCIYIHEKTKCKY